MNLSEKQIYESIAENKISVKEGLDLLLQLDIEKELERLIERKISPTRGKLNKEDGFYEQGLNSGDLLRVVTELESKLKVELYPTLLFEYPSIKELARYLALEFPHKFKPKEIIITEESTELSKKNKDIAIIGLSGRYPGAVDIEEFWENLKKKKDCITIIPEERWDYKKYYHPDKSNKGTTYSKWGGFIDDVDKFDSLFFNISPREAKLMDPQERLFLQEVWHTLENAGYTPEDLAKDTVGVYTGVMYGDYQLFGIDDNLKEKPNAFYASIANRVSYFMNFHGPSITMDTMCSSSLTAIHLACNSINNNECTLAIAGGVNLNLHPNKYLRLSQQNFVSSDGRCRAFGEGGDGYVPGEGIGAVLLKPLKKAVNDRDHIYGVIKSTTINHGGKSSGITVPNPKAQGNLILKALKQADIDPVTISYMEAHGTGTFLGDPIEIAGLTRAFREFTDKKKYCAIGSVKSNIGHLESAAGISALTKVLLQFEHKTKVPSIHSQVLNPHIDFETSPFYVQTKLEQWEPPVLKGQPFPLRAGISSFGAGGSNAHIILENYTLQKEERTPLNDYVILLSARDEYDLKAYAKKITDFLQKEETINLLDFSYTLAAGRKAMPNRLSCVIANKIDLITHLKSFTEHSGTKPEGLFIGRKKSDQTYTRSLSRDRNSLKEAAQNWARGMEVQWKPLFKGTNARRCPLPVYPFKKNRVWIEHNPARTKPDNATGSFTKAPININTLTFPPGKINEQESYAPLFLDMLIFTSGINYGKTPKALFHVHWNSQITQSGSEDDICLKLTRQEKHQTFHIHRSGESSKTPIIEGHFTLTEKNQKKKKFSITDIISRCSRELTAADPSFSLKKSEILPGHLQVNISGINYNNQEALFSLKPPGDEAKKREITASLYIDIAFRCLSLFEKLQNRAPCPPRSMKELTFRQELKETRYIHIIKNESSTDNSYNIQIMNEEGLILVTIEDLITHKADYKELYFTFRWKEKNPPGKNHKMKTIFRLNKKPEKSFITSIIFFIKEYLLKKKKDINTDKKEILFFGDKTLEKKFIINKKKVILVFPGRKYRKKGDHYWVNPEREEDYQRLFTSLEKEKIHPESIIHHWLCEEQFSPDKFSEKLLNKSFYSLFFIVRFLIQQKSKSRIFCLHRFTDEANPFYMALGAFARTLGEESTRILLKIIGIDQRSGKSSVYILEKEWKEDQDREILYNKEGRRLVKTLEPLPPEDFPGETFNPQKDCAYLITGGAGGLGSLFARHLAKTSRNITLFLTGRSAFNNNIRETIKSLEELGAKATYIQADVRDRKNLRELLEKIKKDDIPLKGIIHSAGTKQDALIPAKSREKMDIVLGPKIQGLLNLDEIFKKESLDFFVFFSSSAVLGNRGQADYAYANSFMDNFCRLRNKLVESGRRSGKTISINWPLWQNGGMHADKATTEYLKSVIGIKPISTDTGLSAFNRALSFPGTQLFVFEGKKEKLLPKLNLTPAFKQTPPRENPVPRAGGINKIIVSLFCGLMEIKETLIDINADLSEYGTDSVTLMEFVNKINTALDTTLSPSVFMDYPSLGALIKHLEETRQFPSTFKHKITHQTEPLDVTGILRKSIASLLELKEEQIDLDLDLTEYGMDSVIFTEYINLINRKFSLELSPSVFVDYPTIKALAHFIRKHEHKTVEVFRTPGQGKTLEVTGIMPTSKDRKWQPFSLTVRPGEEGSREKINDLLKKYYRVQLMVQTSEGTKLEAILSGSGDPVLVITGMGMVFQSLEKLLKRLSRSWQSIVIHSPGHGLSGRVKKLSLPLISALYKEVLEMIGVKRSLHIIGSSMGGLIAETFAGQYPGDCRSLTLIGSGYMAKNIQYTGSYKLEDRINEDFDNIISKANPKYLRKNRDKYLEKALKTTRIDSIMALKYQETILKDSSTWNLLPAISCPTLIIFGYYDITLGRDQARKLLEALKHNDPEYYEIENGGHFIFITHLKKITAKIIDFLNR